MCNRYTLLVFGKDPMSFNSDSLEFINGMSHGRVNYIIIDMETGWILEDRRPKVLGDSCQEIYNFVNAKDLENERD